MSEATIPRWLEKLMPKPPAGRLPLALRRRRIYIVPSKFGFVYGITLFFLMLGAFNYNNNAAILLALLLGATALASASAAVRHLAGLEIAGFHAAEAFAGDGQDCRLTLRSRTGAGVRGEVQLRHGDVRLPAVAGAGGEAVLAWRWPSLRRGRRPLGRITLSTTYPLGLFYAWSILEPHADAVVYPAPESPPQPLPQAPDQPGSRHAAGRGDDDWHALREFQRGDSLRDIAWKVSARHERWLVAETRAAQQQPALRFGLDQVAGLERERGISRLARWVLLAEAAQRLYTLELGARRIGPGVGADQRRRALTALAELQ